MRIEFYQPAGTYDVPGKGEFEQRFAPHAFDGCIGQEVPFKIEGVEYAQATVVAVKVNEDGTGATFTVDIPDPDPERTRKVQESARGRFSFSVPEPPPPPTWLRQL